MFFSQMLGANQVFAFFYTKKVADARRGFHFTKTKIVEFMHFCFKDRAHLLTADFFYSNKKNLANRKIQDFSELNES